MLLLSLLLLPMWLLLCSLLLHLLRLLRLLSLNNLATLHQP